MQYHQKEGPTSPEYAENSIFQDLIEQIEKTIDLLFSKYIKAIISYEGINRVETFEYPKDAVREGLLNSAAHKDYSEGTPIQISVYDDKIIIWNEGQLPEDYQNLVIIMTCPDFGLSSEKIFIMKNT